MLLQYIPTEDQDADILTKALAKSKFEYQRGMIKKLIIPFLLRGSAENRQENVSNLFFP